jgi:hypothetical protein
MLLASSWLLVCPFKMVWRSVKPMKFDTSILTTGFT